MTCDLFARRALGEPRSADTRLPQRNTRVPGATDRDAPLASVDTAVWRPRHGAQSPRSRSAPGRSPAKKRTESNRQGPGGACKVPLLELDRLRSLVLECLQLEGVVGRRRRPTLDLVEDVVAHGGFPRTSPDLITSSAGSRRNFVENNTVRPARRSPLRAATLHWQGVMRPHHPGAAERRDPDPELPSEQPLGFGMAPGAGQVRAKSSQLSVSSGDCSSSSGIDFASQGRRTWHKSAPALMSSVGTGRCLGRVLRCGLVLLVLGTAESGRWSRDGTRWLPGDEPEKWHEGPIRDFVTQPRKKIGEMGTELHRMFSGHKVHRHPRAPEWHHFVLGYVLVVAAVVAFILWRIVAASTRAFEERRAAARRADRERKGLTVELLAGRRVVQPARPGTASPASPPRPGYVVSRPPRRRPSREG